MALMLAPDPEVRVGALFAGTGALDLGVTSVLGGHPVWYSEIEAAPCRILEERWPGVPNLGDVTKIDWANVPPVDILTGGSPCQDLSHAGKRAGMRAGTRSGLWASMCDAIEVIRPRLVVWENVRGALSAEADSAVEPCPFCVGNSPRATLRALGRVLGDLAELRYDAFWVGLRAADVGAAHGRFRIFVFAYDALAADADRTRLAGHWQLHPAPGEAQTRPRDRAVADTAGSRGDEAVEHDGRGAAPGDGRGVPDERDREPVWAGPQRGVTLLPTPLAAHADDATDPEAWRRKTEELRARHNNGNGRGMPLTQAVRLLPTPAVYQSEEDLESFWERQERVVAAPHRTGGASGMPLGVAIQQVPLFPTPMAAHHQQNLLDEVLLPTPDASQGGRGGSQDPRKRQAGGHAVSLADVAEKGPLLPTPVTSDAHGIGLHGHGGNDLRTEVSLLPAASMWGPYEAAVRRQEAAFGRLAPEPTEWSETFHRRRRGQDRRPAGMRGSIAGLRRLSPRFVEWMMGLPDGWVCDVPITRNDKLRALGNGVCPQQAAAATRLFVQHYITNVAQRGKE